MRADKRILGDVLGGLPIPNRTIDIVEHRSMHLVEELCESVPLTRLRSTDKWYQVIFRHTCLPFGQDSPL